MGYMGSCYNIPKVIFYLLKGDYKVQGSGLGLGFKVMGLGLGILGFKV